MKRQTKHIAVPINIWEHSDLSPTEKMVLCDLESYCINGETTIGAQAIATSTGIPTKEVKQALASLQDKGGISVRIGSDGEKLISPYLYRERYVSSPENAVKVGTTPTDVLSLPWDDIAEKWQEICFMLPKITRWSPQRKNKLRSALKQAGATLDDLYKSFRLISTSCFLNGTKSDQWSCSFDWLIKSSSNFIKVLEGNYHKDYNEQRLYKDIINGSDISKKDETSDDFYR